MKSVLNITNGDSAVSLMQQAEFPGDFLPWRDVLHEGPVVKMRSLEESSKVRTEFIVSQGWGKLDQVETDFRERDQILKSFDKYDEVILWFEHDLYDQLQLLQILDWFSQQENLDDRLSMICTDNYLGLLTVEQIKTFLNFKENVVNEQLNLAQCAWTAFCDDSPQSWKSLLDRDTSSLPFLEGAVLRMLQEYPSTENGLGRTAQKALEIIAQGESFPTKVFTEYQKTEQRRFLGDWSFWNILNDLSDADKPLLKSSKGETLTILNIAQQQLSITDEGHAALANKIDWLEIKPIDRWIGGVHLLPSNVWRWDQESATLTNQ